MKKLLCLCFWLLPVLLWGAQPSVTYREAPDLTLTPTNLLWSNFTNDDSTITITKLQKGRLNLRAVVAPSTDLASVTNVARFWRTNANIINVRLPPYSVPQFGEVGGADDASPGLQQAMNDAADAGGKEVFLPAGTYNLRSALYMRANVHLRGETMGNDQWFGWGTRIKGNSTFFPAYNNFLLMINHESNVVSGTTFYFTQGWSISGITFDGVGAAKYGVRVGNSGSGNASVRGTMSQCYFTRFSHAGLYLLSPQGCLFEGVSASYCSNGVEFARLANSSATATTFKSCRFAYNTNNGAWIGQGIGLTFDSTIFEYNGYEGVVMECVSHNSWPIDNTFFNHCWIEHNNYDLVTAGYVRTNGYNFKAFSTVADGSFMGDVTFSDSMIYIPGPNNGNFDLRDGVFKIIGGQIRPTAGNDFMATVRAPSAGGLTSVTIDSATNDVALWRAEPGAYVTHVQRKGQQTVTTIYDGVNFTNVLDISASRFRVGVPLEAPAGATVGGTFTASNDPPLLNLSNFVAGVSNLATANQSGSFTLSNLLAMGITNIVAGTNVVIQTNNGTLVVNAAGGQVGSLTLTNFVAMGITNIIAGTNAVIYTNDGVLVINGSAAGGGAGGPSTSNNIPGNASYVGGTTNFILDCGATNLYRMTFTQNSGIILTNCIDGQDVNLEVTQAGAVLYTALLVPSVGGVWTNNIRFCQNITGLAFASNSLTIVRFRYIAANTLLGASNVLVTANNWGY